jgi:hypothetical protein
MGGPTVDGGFLRDPQGGLIGALPMRSEDRVWFG